MFGFSVQADGEGAATEAVPTLGTLPRQGAPLYGIAEDTSSFLPSCPKEGACCTSGQPCALPALSSHQFLILYGFRSIWEALDLFWVRSRSEVDLPGMSTQKRFSTLTFPSSQGAP